MLSSCPFLIGETHFSLLFVATRDHDENARMLKTLARPLSLDRRFYYSGRVPFFAFLFLNVLFLNSFLNADSSGGAITRQVGGITYASQRRISPPSSGSKETPTPMEAVAAS